MNTAYKYRDPVRVLRSGTWCKGVVLGVMHGRAYVNAIGPHRQESLWQPFDEVQPDEPDIDIAAEVDALPRCCVYSPAINGDVRKTA